MGDQLCSLLSTLTQQVFIPLAVIAALGGAIYFGLAYAASGIFPELSGRMRQAPKNILIGFLALGIGPLLVSMLASAFGVDFTCDVGLASLVPIIESLVM